MSESEPPVESTDELALSYQLLKDQGLEFDDRDYSLGNMTKMWHSVRIVNEFASGLPVEVKIQCIMKYLTHFARLNLFAICSNHR